MCETLSSNDSIAIKRKEKECVAGCGGTHSVSEGRRITSLKPAWNI
jgi:hypothetical protein